MGFTDDSKKEYIEQELKHYPEKMERLVSYLDNHQTINSICYIPMIMSILVCTFKEIEELPSDQTELYERFISLAISRYVQKLKDNPSLVILSLQHLPEIYENYLLELSKFAFYNLRGDKIVFTSEDIEKSCPKLSSANNDFHGLGLLKSTQYFSMKKIDNCMSYNFLHLSLQEYLAAYYINSLNPCKQFELLKNSFFSEKYTNTWIMFAGLGKKTMFDYCNYSVYGMPCGELRNKVLSYILHLNSFEGFSQAINLCLSDRVLGCCKLLCFKNSEIKSNDDILRTVDNVVLLNELTSTEFTWSKLYLSLCHTNGNLMKGYISNKNLEETLYCRIASKLYTNNQLSVVILNVSSIIMHKANKQQIRDGLVMNNCITNLIMKECCIDDETAEIISCYIKTSNMICVVFEGCTFYSSASKVIFDALSSISTLKYMIIDDSHIDEATALVLSLVIERNIKLSHIQINCHIQSKIIQVVSALKRVSAINGLILSNNSIPENAINNLVEAIAINSNLRSLYLDNNNLQHHGALVASALCKITSLTTLDLSNNNMTEEVADKIALAIGNNNSIKELHIRGNIFRADGIIKIAQSLCGLTCLNVLDASNNHITEGAAESVAKAILSNPALEELYLSDNQLGTGALKIIAALNNISKLRVLDLSSNNMSVAVATELAAVIISNSSLEDLRLSDNRSRLTTSSVATIARTLCNINTEVS